MSVAAPLQDSHGRAMGDLRISLTDRCNFRCLYCLPETEAAANFYQQRFAPAGRTFSTELIQRKWQPRTALLSYEEIERVVRIFVGLGIRKIRLTGGEPLLRQDVELIVERLARIGVRDPDARLPPPQKGAVQQFGQDLIQGGSLQMIKPDLARTFGHGQPS